ncbi:hypothetical protein BDZ91DRAFT_797615 [Kalaharituber pfeilii]|nr:hypothetical protein BDZ91DRAFT_797615 [Kalaharituber pfeilii]
MAGADARGFGGDAEEGVPGGRVRSPVVRRRHQCDGMGLGGEVDQERLRVKLGGITGRVAEKWGVPLEKTKHEDIVFGKGKRRRKEVERVKWLGVIFDSTLDFDFHWKARIEKARKHTSASPGMRRQMAKQRRRRTE